MTHEHKSKQNKKHNKKNITKKQTHPLFANAAKQTSKRKHKLPQTHTGTRPRPKWSLTYVKHTRTIPVVSPPFMNKHDRTKGTGIISAATVYSVMTVLL